MKRFNRPLLLFVAAGTTRAGAEFDCIEFGEPQPDGGGDAGDGDSDGGDLGADGGSSVDGGLAGDDTGTDGGVCDCSGEPPAEVCGANGTTYRNQCVIECMQVPKAHDGPCLQGGDGCGCGNRRGQSGPLFILLPLCIWFARRRR